MTVTSTRVEEVLKQLGQEWAAAELQGDTKFLDQLFTDEFIGIGPRGFMLSKKEWLDRHTSGDLKYQSFTWSEVEVRPYMDAAVVTGRQALKGSYKGQDTGGEFRSAQFFVKQNGLWRIAALQLSPIMGPPQPNRQ